MSETAPATIADTLTELVRQARDAAGHAEATVPLEPCVPTNNPEHGDYQSNFAFRLGKSLRTNPRAVATQIAEALPAHPAIAKVDVAGPGFLNFKLADDWLAADVQARAADPRLGAPLPGEGRTVVIDYSSPNIAKRMHIGHLRSTIIGDALRRLYEFNGWTVVADNHVGDWGTQFGKLIVAWDRWLDKDAYEADPIGELQRIYQKFGVEAKDDPALIDEARARTVDLQNGDIETTALWQQFIDASMVEFDGMYERLDVHFDVVHGESFYRHRLQDLVDQLLASGLAKVNDGAVIIEFDPEDGKGLKNSPMLIRKSDGAALYGTSDIATVQHRVETWNPERIVYVTDTRQQLHFRQVFAAVKKMGIDAVDFRHVWFGILRFPDGATASTRAGATANLVDVLDTAASRARTVVEEVSRELGEDEKAAIAEAVGVGAVKVFDLSQNPQTDITFDWDRSLALDGASAPYFMYAHARCRSILRKAADQGFTPGELVLGEELERALALGVARLPEAVQLAAETSRPNLLVDHLFGVAQTFSSFYNAHRVLDADNSEATTRSRLQLVAAVAHCLQIGLALLGVTAPERM